MRLRAAQARLWRNCRAGWRSYRAGETGLLRMTWDNGDRTVLVNPELSGVTLGWRLTHTAQDELFAAIEGTAFHTRVILERMEEHGVPVRRDHQWRRHSAKKSRAQPRVRERDGQADPGSEWRCDQPGFGDLRVSRRGRIPKHRSRRRMRCARGTDYRARKRRRRTSTRICTRSIASCISVSDGASRNRGDVLPELRRIAAAARGGQSAGSAAS